MKYGICNLSIVPIRYEANDKSEQTSQLLYGETFIIVEEKIREKLEAYISEEERKGN